MLCGLKAALEATANMERGFEESRSAANNPIEAEGFHENELSEKHGDQSCGDMIFEVDVPKERGVIGPDFECGAVDVIWVADNKLDSASINKENDIFCPSLEVGATENATAIDSKYFGASECVADTRKAHLDWVSSANNEFVTKERSMSDFNTLFPSAEVYQLPSQTDAAQRNSRFSVSYEYDYVYPALSSPNGLRMAANFDSFHTSCSRFGNVELYSMDSVLHETRGFVVRDAEAVQYHNQGINDSSPISSKMSETEMRQNWQHSANRIITSLSTSAPSSSRNVLSKSSNLSFIQNGHDNLYHGQDDSLGRSYYEWNPNQDVPGTVSAKLYPHGGSQCKKVVHPQIGVATTKQRDPHESIKNEMYNMYVVHSANCEELEDRYDNLGNSMEKTVASVAENSSRKRNFPEVSWKAEESVSPQKKFMKTSMPSLRDPDQLAARVMGVDRAFVVRECIYSAKKEQECAASTSSHDTDCESNALSRKKRANKFVQTGPSFEFEGNSADKNVKEATVNYSLAPVEPTQSAKKRGKEKLDQPAECQVFLVVRTPESTDASSVERRCSPRLQNQREVFYGEVKRRNTKKIKQEELKHGSGDALDKKVNCEQRSECSQSPSARRASQRSRCPRRAFSPSHKTESGSLVVAPVCKLRFIRMSKSGRSALDVLNIELKEANTSLEEKSLNSYVQTTT